MATRTVLIVVCASVSLAVVSAVYSDEMPILDFSQDRWRHTVVCAGTADERTGYFCHPSTLLTPDGRTLFCTWTLGHAGSCGCFARSDDGGKSWTRLDGLMPTAFAEMGNCPTFQMIPNPVGGYNFCVYAVIC